MENNVFGLPPLAVNAVCHSGYSPGFVCQVYLEIQIQDFGFVCRTYQEIQVEVGVGDQEQVELEVKEQVEVGRQK